MCQLVWGMVQPYWFVMTERKLTYSFHLFDRDHALYEVEFDADTFEFLDNSEVELPEWTRLNCHQCDHCPLSPDEVLTCPLAASIAKIVQIFQDIVSYDDVYLVVESAERVIQQKTTMQRALGSLMGVVMTGSGCPYTKYFKPMACFHLPLANERETIYRAASMYLLAQYFKKREGLNTNFSLKGLDTIYKNIQKVNVSIVARLRGISSGDSTINAVVFLDMYARVMPFVIEESLEEIRYLFEPYLT